MYHFLPSLDNIICISVYPLKEGTDADLNSIVQSVRFISYDPQCRLLEDKQCGQNLGENHQEVVINYCFDLSIDVK